MSPNGRWLRTDDDVMELFDRSRRLLFTVGKHPRFAAAFRNGLTWDDFYQAALLRAIERIRVAPIRLHDDAKDTTWPLVIFRNLLKDEIKRIRLVRAELPPDWLPGHPRTISAEETSLHESLPEGWEESLRRVIDGLPPSIRQSARDILREGFHPFPHGRSPGQTVPGRRSTQQRSQTFRARQRLKAWLQSRLEEDGRGG